LSLPDEIPDETTLYRFRNRFVVNDRLDGLLASINKQLQSHGLMIKGATGAVIEDTLIKSAARPKKTITLEVDAEGKGIQFEDGSQPGISCTEGQSADAIWLKKGRKSRFGYCSYLVVDAQDGYVPGGFTLPPPIRAKCCILKPLSMVRTSRRIGYMPTKDQPAPPTASF